MPFFPLQNRVQGFAVFPFIYISLLNRFFVHAVLPFQQRVLIHAIFTSYNAVFPITYKFIEHVKQIKQFTCYGDSHWLQLKLPHNLIPECTFCQGIHISYLLLIKKQFFLTFFSFSTHQTLSGNYKNVLFLSMINFPFLTHNTSRSHNID